MKKVLLRAPVLTQSGYGVHSRQVARWLVGLAERKEIELMIQCVPWGDTTWYVNPDDFDGLIGKMMKHVVGHDARADVSFQVILPNEWDPQVATYNVGVTAGVETDRCNPAWINNINAMNQVIVPSQHVKSSFLRTGTLTTPVTVIPESFPDSLSQDDCKSDRFHFDTDFNFLIFGQLTSPHPQDDRKNIIKTIQLIRECFKDHEDVGVILKSNVGRSSIMDYKATQAVVTSAVKSAGTESNVKVNLIHGNFSDEILRDLYLNPKVKCLISLTRGEGFGLPILESAACALPVIATKWSAYTDYMKGDSYLKVKYNLVPLSETRVDSNIFMAGAQWAEFDEKSAKECVEKIYKHYMIYKKRALDHQQSIRQTHTFDAIQKLYSDKFRAILC